LINVYDNIPTRSAIYREAAQLLRDLPLADPWGADFYLPFGLAHAANVLDDRAAALRLEGK